MPCHHQPGEAEHGTVRDRLVPCRSPFGAMGHRAGTSYGCVQEATAGDGLVHPASSKPPGRMHATTRCMRQRVQERTQSVRIRSRPTVSTCSPARGCLVGVAVSPARHTTRQVSLTLGCRGSERQWILFRWRRGLRLHNRPRPGAGPFDNARRYVVNSCLFADTGSYPVPIKGCCIGQVTRRGAQSYLHALSETTLAAALMVVNKRPPLPGR